MHAPSSFSFEMSGLIFSGEVIHGRRRTYFVDDLNVFDAVGLFHEGTLLHASYIASTEFGVRRSECRSSSNTFDCLRLKVLRYSVSGDESTSSLLVPVVWIPRKPRLTCASFMQPAKQNQQTINSYVKVTDLCCTDSKDRSPCFSLPKIIFQCCHHRFGGNSTSLLFFTLTFPSV
jgi:hypothetical protein